MLIIVARMHPLPESLLSEVYFLDFESFCGDDFGCDALAEGLGLVGRLSILDFRLNRARAAHALRDRELTNTRLC